MIIIQDYITEQPDVMELIHKCIDKQGMHSAYAQRFRFKLSKVQIYTPYDSQEQGEKDIITRKKGLLETSM